MLDVINNGVDLAGDIPVFKPQTFQRPFLESTSLFPGYVAPWGSGKTLCMIVKGMILSQMYPGNQGLIIRSQYRSLQKSTIKDFQAWTGLKVPDQKQEVEVPSTNSTIVFSHADNVEDFRYAIQGMNLGWVGIEQADEMDNAEVFEMCMGRVRRILTPNRQMQEELIKLGVLKDYVADFAKLRKERREEVEKTIIEVLKLPVRQIMTIANTNGHNWMWKRWKKRNPDRDKEYVLFEGKAYENRENIPEATFRMWETLKRSNPKRHARYVLNSWEDYDIEGAYYAALMSDALKAKRVEIDTLYDVNVPVYTFWDLGIRASDTTAIWFVQFIGNEIWLIDYHEEYGKGMNHYSKVLNEKGYDYAAHYLPPDASQRLQGREITTRLDIMRGLRREPVRSVERHRVEERIACVRGLLNRCKFNSRCERGVAALNYYQAKRDESRSLEERPVFKSTPKDDEWTNGCYSRPQI